MSRHTVRHGVLSSDIYACARMYVVVLLRLRLSPQLVTYIRPHQTCSKKRGEIADIRRTSEKTQFGKKTRGSRSDRLLKVDVILHYFTYQWSELAVQPEL